MRKMKDSGVKWIGEIPGDWKTSKFKYHVENLDGKRVPIDSALRVNGIYPYWGAGSITDYVDDYLFDEELILLGEDGAPFFDPYRPVAFLVNEKIWVNNHIHVLRPKSSINALFVTYFLNIVDYGTYINGTILNKLTQSNLKKIAIVYPSLEKQEKIVHYLDDKCSRIDFVISKQKQIIEKLRLYRESVIAEVVTKGCNSNVSIKDSGISWIGYIPCHWKVLKLRAHAQMLTPMRDKPEKLDGDIPWIRIEDYNGKYISESKEGLGVSKETIELMNLKVYPVNSILCTSSCDLGKCAIVAKELVSNQRFINIIPDKDACSDYLYYLMLSNAKRLNYLSTGTIQANLSRVAFEHLLVQFPPKEEQEIIAHYLDKKCEAIDRQIDERQLLIARLKEYKRALIFECVTGKKEISARPNAFSNTGIKPAVLEQIRNLAKNYGIRKIILFGSRARGTFHRDSDIDLAVSGGNIDLFRLAVEEETDTLLAYDVVNLDRTSNEELLDVIRKEGVIIYEEV